MLDYDYLIVAAGATHAYFGHDEWRSLAPGLKSLEDALEIRRRVLLAFERAEREVSDARRRALLTFVVVGGGPTGVEMAGALAEIAHQSLARDFRHIDPTSARILMVEAGPAVLATFPEALRESARRDLERLGVEVRTGQPVTQVAPGFIEIGAERIDAETVVWAAGRRRISARRDARRPTRSRRTRPHPAGPDDSRASRGVRHRRSGVARWPERQSHIPAWRRWRFRWGSTPRANITRAIEHQPLAPFHYRDLGNMATIGRASAVADFGWLELKGYLGWLSWAFVHILNLIGFRNRLVVFVQWAWAYFSYQRSIRLITGETEAAPKAHAASRS